MLRMPYTFLLDPEPDQGEHLRNHHTYRDNLFRGLLERESSGRYGFACDVPRREARLNGNPS